MKNIYKNIILIVVCFIFLVIINLIFVFLRNKPLFYYKVDNSDKNIVYYGLLYNSFVCKENEGIVIKNKFSNYSCYSEPNDLLLSFDNVDLILEEVSDKGCKVIIKDLNNSHYDYYEWYQLEVYKEDNWVELDSFEDIEFSNKVYKIKDNMVSFIVNWENRYGRLNSGRYRMVKKVNNRFIYEEFVIDYKDSYDR